MVTNSLALFVMASSCEKREGVISRNRSLRMSERFVSPA